MEIAVLDDDEAVVAGGFAAALCERVAGEDAEVAVAEKTLHVVARLRAAASELVHRYAEVVVLLAHALGKARVGFGGIDEVQPHEKLLCVGALHQKAVSVIALVGDVAAGVQAMPSLLGRLRRKAEKSCEKQEKRRTEHVVLIAPSSLQRMDQSRRI